MRLQAKENRYGHIEIYRTRLYDGEQVSDCPLYLQSRTDCEGFRDSLSKYQEKALNDGYEISIPVKSINGEFILHQLSEV